LRRQEASVTQAPAAFGIIDLMRSLLRVWLVSAPGILFSQTPATLPSFEVASVKPAGAEEHPLGRGIFTFPGGRILINKVTLLKLVQEAFDLQPFQVAGGPRWAGEDRYNIEAIPPPSSQSSHANPSTPKAPLNPEQRQMLQALLIGRFHLTYHTENKEGLVYFLTRAGKELRMQDAKNKDEFAWSGGLEGGVIMGDGLAGRNESMADLAKRLGPYLGRPVLDRTELPGSFDFRVVYNSDEAHPDIASVILASVRELGLKLEAGRGPVETLVIDSAEKPSAN
jgi:uncharacterized protein (TIGR03435 family)